MTEEQEQMCEDCMRKERMLTDWEQQFIDSIYTQEKPLSSKQANILTKIWDRVT